MQIANNESDGMHSFIGLILLPIVGNAGKSTDLVSLPPSALAANIAYRLPSPAEHVTSVW
jgi:hypothetical protein